MATKAEHDPEVEAEKKRKQRKRQKNKGKKPKVSYYYHEFTCCSSTFETILRRTIPIQVREKNLAWNKRSTC